MAAGAPVKGRAHHVLETKPVLVNADHAEPGSHLVDPDFDDVAMAEAAAALEWPDEL
jgi:hypothetical protein